VDGTAAGWCNANDKVAYNSLRSEKWPELWEEGTADEKIKAVVCYTIAPEMRRKGIATKLLAAVCEDARTEGYTCVEAYPEKCSANIIRSYHGPYDLYEKAGFTLHKDLKDIIIVRKYLVSNNG
jgi:GNAT superfamily N-acetyltransferase